MNTRETRSYTQKIRNDTSQRRNFLFVIGIDNYGAFPKLNNAVRDVQKFTKLLVSDFGFSKKKYFSHILTNENATRKNIISHLNKLCNIVTCNDRVLIYFSGHGYLNPNTKKGYWVPIEAKSGDISSYLSNSEIYDYLPNIEGKHILIISDSCFSGSFIPRASVSDHIDEFEDWESNKSRWFLSSGKTIVQDGEKGKNSPFASCLIRHLTQLKSDKVNISKLANQISTSISSNYMQKPEASFLTGTGDEGGQFIFYRQRKKANNIDDVKKKASSSRKRKIQVSNKIDSVKITHGYFTDPRDNKIYNTITLNNEKEWLAKNINFVTKDGSFLYDNDISNGEKYGRLYTREAALKACPPGWKLPTATDWKNLIEHYGKLYLNFDDAKKGKRNGLDGAYGSLISNGKSGFSASLGGVYYPFNKTFGFQDQEEGSGAYWSETPFNSQEIFTYTFHGHQRVVYQDKCNKNWGISCRYVKIHSD